MKKLIRDKLAEWIKENDKNATVEEIQDPDEMMNYLKKKVVEEAVEVYQTNRRADAIEEICDLYEVVSELMNKWNIKESDVWEARVSKFEKRGGFSKGYILNYEENRINDCY